MAEILGLGTAQPEHRIDQRAAAEVARSFVFGEEHQTRILPALFRRTQVRRRGSVLLEPPNGEEFRQSFYPPAADHADRGPSTAQRMTRYASDAAPLAAAAACRALEESRCPAEAITQLITVSCTGFVAPGIDVALIKCLGLSPEVGRLNVGFMGCHGALNGLRAAGSFVSADPQAKVLLCAVELCSLHYQYGWEPDRVLANALFADGAAALVAGRPDPASAGSWRLAACGSYLVPESEGEMTWRIGNHGFEMSLSARVPELIARHLRPWMERWLASQGLRLADVASWAVHPGGPRIISSVAEALDLPDQALENSSAVLAECGNMSSATMFFVLDRYRRRAARTPCVALGFGPGLIIEAALFWGPS